jgi:hypothetical protein
MVMRTRFAHERPQLVAWIGYALIALACLVMIWLLATN